MAERRIAKRGQVVARMNGALVGFAVLVLIDIGGRLGYIYVNISNLLQIKCI